ncbi:hypothetical protein EHV15_35970 [Paenibacillus oralis]|uniref:Uncharacterized protein n=1 Tax=Paenibacillus oralis TaxID=2490856 RepID=A0A3P3TBS9_9BACL|nr:hypothetical protein [Paenibacillus oralis]RRJ54969.1 hypothetical protein EHV15_35970 [Paenibacillus oralis]
MELIIDGVKIKSLKDVDDYIARFLHGHNISAFENPYKDEPRASETGVYSIHQCSRCRSTHRIEEDLAAAGYQKNQNGFFDMWCFDCSMAAKEQWACPNGCEIDYVLVCGGDLGNADRSNVYFQMKLDGTYTDLFQDGALGVPAECHEHANGGCCKEPYCPECRVECINIAESDDSGCKDN